MVVLASWRFPLPAKIISNVRHIKHPAKWMDAYLIAWVERKWWDDKNVWRLTKIQLSPKLDELQASLQIWFTFRPVILFSKLNKIFLGCFKPENIFLTIKLSNFRGDLTNTLAHTATLIQMWKSFAVIDTEIMKKAFFSLRTNLLRCITEQTKIQNP